MLHALAPLVRTTASVCKDWEPTPRRAVFVQAFYNVARPHRSLRVPWPEGTPPAAEMIQLEWGHCDGQVKTDSELRHPGQPLEVIGTDIPQIRVQPLAVVEHFDVIDHIIPRFLPRGIAPPGRTLPLDTSEEPLGHGIV